MWSLNYTSYYLIIKPISRSIGLAKISMMVVREKNQTWYSNNITTFTVDNHIINSYEKMTKKTLIMLESEFKQLSQLKLVML